MRQFGQGKSLYLPYSRNEAFRKKKERKLISVLHDFVFPMQWYSKVLGMWHDAYKLVNFQSEVLFSFLKMSDSKHYTSHCRERRKKYKHC